MAERLRLSPMDVVELAGRLLLAATFLITPWGVLGSAARVAGSPGFTATAALAGLPMGVRVAMIRATCLAAMTGAILIGVGLWPDLGALLVLAFLVPVTLVMHRFWEVEEWLSRKQKRDAFLANVSMAGGALLLFAFVNASQDVAVGVLSDPLFGRA